MFTPVLFAFHGSIDENDRFIIIIIKVISSHGINGGN